MRKLFLIVLLFSSPALAQSYLVRTCPTQVTGSWGACPNPQWSIPANNLIVDSILANSSTDQWSVLSNLKTGDRVFLCSTTYVAPGPFGNGCQDSTGAPVYYPGQTDDWVDVSKLIISTGSSVTITWSAPTEDITSAVLPTGTQLTYNVYGAQCTTAPCTNLVKLASGITSTTTVLQNVSPGFYCYTVSATDSAGEGPQSSPQACKTVIAPSTTPSPPSNLSVQ